MPRQLESHIVKEWLDLVSGKFSTKDIWDELGILSPAGKTHLRKILQRFEEQDLIVSLGTGYYRKKDADLKPVDWQSADISQTLPILFPFGEHEVVSVYGKSIIVVTGDKNVGKTAYLYNFIALNMDKFIIDLYNTETLPAQMKARFEPLDIPAPAPFNVYERYDNFSDIIHPDHISVIDYLDYNSELYLVGSEIDAIFRRLNTGVAVIALQKPPPTVIHNKDGSKKLIERDLAYGGAFTAKRAILYITISSNKLKLLYVKTPKNPKINPNNMTWQFSINGDGIHFIDVQRSYGTD